MKKTILVYGVLMAVLIWLLKLLDYRFFVHDITMEMYVGLTAAGFTVFGIWLGLKLTRPKVIIQETAFESFAPDLQRMEEVGLSKREYDVLELMAQGLSNQEIADKLFISLNTVKTHSSKVFMKLDVKRRTQAVQQAKELGILP